MKILELLKTLSDTELIRFEKFINSPYHNENNNIIVLFSDFIQLVLKQEAKSELIKGAFIDKINWSDSKFRKSCNELLELLLEFNAIEFNRKNELFEKIQKYIAILDKKWISKLSKKSDQIRSLKANKNSWKEVELALYYIFLKSQIDSNLFKPQESLHIYAEIAQIRKVFLKSSELSSSIDLEHLRQANFQMSRGIYRDLSPLNNERIKLYKAVDLLFQGKDTKDNLEKIKQIIISLLPLEKSFKNGIMNHCAGYLSTLINKGQLNVIEDLYALYKFGIEIDAIILEVGTYRNIAFLACRSNDFEWALEFVEKHKTRLAPEDRESAYSFTKARTLWYAKDWEGVIRTLRNVEYQDMTYNLITKAYIMTCYYELDEDEALDSFIKAFKVFLRRKRNISKRRKDAFYGFTTVIGDLAKARERNAYKRIIKAREELTNNPSIPNQDWLTEKIEELEAVIPQPKSKSKA